MSNLTTHEGDCGARRPTYKSAGISLDRSVKDESRCNCKLGKIRQLEAALTIAKEALCQIANSNRGRLPGIEADIALAEIAKVMG